MMDRDACSKHLVEAIGDFEREYRDDQRFRETLSDLDRVRKDVERLVPSVTERPTESPGRRDAREISEEGRARRSSRENDDTRVGTD